MGMAAPGTIPTLASACAEYDRDPSKFPLVGAASSLVPMLL
jgi:hypothetical protein